MRRSRRDRWLDQLAAKGTTFGQQDQSLYLLRRGLVDEALALDGDEAVRAFAARHNLEAANFGRVVADFRTTRAMGLPDIGHVPQPFRDDEEWDSIRGAQTREGATR